MDRAGPAELAEVLAEHAAFWGERDVRGLHNPMLVHEFGDTALIVRGPSGRIDGYLFGLLATAAPVGYVHLIAVRDSARGAGVGRELVAEFRRIAVGRGATRLKAITTPANSGSIAFHRALGFDAELVPDYAGPGQDRVVFTRTA